jgi:hypothetical protein
VGERAAEAAAGYIPHVEEPEEVGPADAKELGDSRAELRGHDAEPEPVLGLTDPNDDSPRQAYSQQQQVEHLAEERRTHESLIKTVGNAEVAACADAFERTSTAPYAYEEGRLIDACARAWPFCSHNSRARVLISSLVRRASRCCCSLWRRSSIQATSRCTVV